MTRLFAIKGLVILACLPLASDEGEQKKPKRSTDATSAKIRAYIDEHKAAADKPAVVVFFATWCNPCRKEFPDVVKAAKETDDKAVWIAVSIDKEKKNADIDAMAGGFPGAVFRMTDHGDEDFFKVKSIPVCVVYDRERKQIVAKGSLEKAVERIKK